MGKKWIQTLKYTENTFCFPVPGSASLLHFRDFFFPLVSVAGYAQSLLWGNEQYRTGGCFGQYIAVFLLHYSHFSSALAKSFYGWLFLRSTYLLWYTSSTGCKGYMLHHWEPPPSLTFVFPLLFVTPFCSLLFLWYFLPLNTFAQRWHKLGSWAQLCL